MAVYKRGDVWWYKFTWRGEPIRESTKQGNKRIAEQIESARKTCLDVSSDQDLNKSVKF